ncbi:hypothetical protein B0H11DRAFT_2256170 [Mycena galericulata]|nr:hypothetical protein B0H11DRAFT_2256170 [Mycena galericulata]
MTITDNALAKSATASPATLTKDSATSTAAFSKATSEKDSDTDTTQRIGGDESEEVPELHLCADDDSDDDGMPPLEAHTLGEIAAAITEANYYRSLAAFRQSDPQRGERWGSMDYILASPLGPQALAVSYDVACQWHRAGVTDGEGVENVDAQPRGNTNASPGTDALGPWRELTQSSALEARSRM